MTEGREAGARPGLPRWVVWLILCLPALLFLPGILGGIAFPSDTAPYTDLLVTHLPYAQYIKLALMEHRVVPLWYQTIYSGTPLAANPLAGLFYPPGWLALVFPLPEGISLCLALHLVLGSWGMYRFLRVEGLGKTGALVGGLAFGLMPKIAAHYGAGHVSLLYAISWTPWLLRISRGEFRGWKTGAVAAAIFLADPRWAVYAGILWLGYHAAHRQNPAWKKAPGYYFNSALLALLLSAPLLIPLLEYSGLATRSAMSAGDLIELALPAERLLGLLIPTAGGNTEWYVYCGGSLISLFAVQFTDRALRARNRFWAAMFAASILLAVGAGYLHFDWLARLPVISLLRVPARFMFLAGLALAIIAGNTIDWMVAGNTASSITRKTTWAVLLFAGMMAAGILLASKGISLMGIWGFAALAAGAGLIMGSMRGKVKLNWGHAFLLLIVLDLGGAGLSSFSVKSFNQLDQDLNPIVELLERDQTLFRIYSPSYSMPQHIAVATELELADGVDPMQIAQYVRVMEAASGVPSEGYAVSIPAFKTGNPVLDNMPYEPDASLLGLLNVKYILAEYQVSAEELALEGRFDNRYLYRNKLAFPRAWVEPVGSSRIGADFSQFREAKILSKTPNRISILAEGPGKLILSEISYPGWKTYVDGKLTAVEPTYDLLRGVEIGNGSHVVEYRYLPGSLLAGLALAAGGWALYLWQGNRK